MKNSKKSDKKEKKRENEEYRQLKLSFEVEDSGSHMDEREEFEKHIDEFIEFIKKNKVVFLEDLAVKYQLQPMEIVEKIESLEIREKISGIMDEKGKYIYISPEEMKNVAKFIMQRGRVTISDIARESNKLIVLTPQYSSDEIEQ